MRIRKLRLERFGHFTDAEIDLSASEDGASCLHLVLGPNEAGKTTALVAIGDLLFGIHPQSPYNFVHAHREMRLAAELESEDGRRLFVRRRKGNKDTLLGDDGRVVPEAALVAFLGPANRAFFDGMFGLNHERLRQGGRDMLAARGDVGQSLFEAGAGLSGLVRTLQRLDEDAGALFTSRRSAGKPFYVALDAYNDARARLRSSAVTSDEWRAAEAKQKDAQQRLDETRGMLQEMSAKRSRAERARRVLPTLRQIRQLEEELARDLAEVPDLPGDAEVRRQAAQRNLEQALRDEERAADEVARIEGDLCSLLPPAGALVARKADIARLVERRGAELKGREDMPKLRAQARQAEDDVRARLHRLGRELDLASVRGALPAATLVAEIRELARREPSLSAARIAAAQAATEAEAETTRLGLLLDASAETPDPIRLREALEAASRAGPLERQLADAEAVVERARKRLAAAVSALPLWSGRDEIALAAAPVPDAASVARFDAALVAAKDEANRAGEEVRRLTDEIADVEEEIVTLKQGEEVPTRAVVEDARERRDDSWMHIRAKHIDCVGSAQAPSPEAYEELVRAADRLVDRREDDAARVAGYEAAVGRFDRLRQALLKAISGNESAETKLAAIAAEWRALWEPCGLAPLPPREMVAWLSRRAETLALANAREDAAIARDRIAATIEEHVAALRAALIAHGGVADAAEPDASASLRALVECARSTLASIDQARSDRMALVKARDDQKRLGVRHQSAAKEAEDALTAWRKAWARALSALALDPSLLPAAAEAALGEWTEIERVSAGWAQLKHRIDRLEEDDEQFRSDVADLLTVAGAADLEDIDALDAVPVLNERLRAAEADALRRADADKRLVAAREHSREAGEQATEARSQLEALRRAAGCATVLDLGAVVARSTRKANVRRDLEELKGRLAAGGDGFDRAHLEAEIEGVDPDRLEAEIVDIGQETQRLQEAMSTMGAELKGAADQLAALSAGRGAADAAEDAQGAVADLKEATIRWARLRIAAVMLRRGVDRYREEQQAPLLARASELFRALTLGSFSELKLAFNERDEVVLAAERPSGEQRDVEALSDGARDQLFLALRMAAVERYVAEAEPLPFVADDLFVNFDDERTTAGLKQLAAFSASTQTLLFTHHAHLVEIARRCLPSNVLAVHSLRRPI